MIPAVPSSMFCCKSAKASRNATRLFIASLFNRGFNIPPQSHRCRETRKREIDDFLVRVEDAGKRWAAIKKPPVRTGGFFEGAWWLETAATD